MKKVLFPLAHSENARTNFLYALDWAAQFKASLVVMYAVDNLSLHNNKKTGEANIESTKAMMEFVSMNKPSQYAYVKIEYVVPIGFPVEAILTAIKEDDIGMVVIGRQAHPTAMETYFSDVALDVLHKVNIPVLLVPENHDYHPIRNIIYPFDLKFKEFVVIEKLIEWSKLLEARLNCIYVLEKNKDYEKIDRLFSTIEDIYFNHKKSRDHIQFEMTEGKFTESMIEFIEQLEMDLLVIHSNQKNIKEHFSSKSNTITSQINIPILVVKESYMLSHKFFKIKESVLN